jgi:predicted component of type VI protein secretion system
MQDYLKLPIRFAQFFNGNRLDTCSLKDSVIRNLHLLVTTTTGENKQDDLYGAAFWDDDYDIHLSNDARREIVISSLKKQVFLYEKRLQDVTIEVNVKQLEYRMNTGSQIRRRIEIIISGLLVRNNEPFRFQTGFFIGPMSFD